MCVPYPHPECIQLSGLSVGGLVALLGTYVAVNAVVSDPVEFDEGGRGFAVFTGLFMVGVVAAGVVGTTTDALPPVVGETVTLFTEGLGYYLVLAYGPITVAFLALGLGSVSVAITHLLLEKYV